MKKDHKFLSVIVLKAYVIVHFPTLFIKIIFPLFYIFVVWDMY